jgi:MoaA/NifB/PqqE/SkfB family radical SAM enzyme
MKSRNIRKVVKGMSAYYTDTEKIRLGRSAIDFLMLNVPPLCNYRCKKCFMQASSREVKNPLTLEEMFGIIRKGKELGAKSVSILGEGEPLLYRNIKDVISFIDRLGMTPIIATNGMMLTREMADFLHGHNTTIGFSLDTLDARKYRDYCGGNADLSKVIENIRYARMLYADRIYEKNSCRVYQLLVHMTVTPENFKDMKAIEEFCGEDMSFDCQPLAYVGDAKQNRSCFGKEITYEQYQKEGHLIYPPMVLSKTEKGKYVCCLFNYGLAISSDGEVMFDTHAVEPRKYIGNVREIPAEELLERAKRLRNFFLENYQSGYCPVRDRSYHAFLRHLRQGRLEL